VHPGDLKRHALMTDSDADCRQLLALERQNETDAVDCCHHLDTFGHKRLRLLLRGRDVTDWFIDRAASVAPSREAYKRISAEVVRSLGHVLWTDSRCSLSIVYFSFVGHFY